jgi:hypothetical protein
VCCLLTDDFYENLLFEFHVQLFDEENIFDYLNSLNYYYMIRDNHQFPLERRYYERNKIDLFYLEQYKKQVKLQYCHCRVMYQEQDHV